jgi:hypothetical protein
MENHEHVAYQSQKHIQAEEAQEHQRFVFDPMILYSGSSPHVLTLLPRTNLCLCSAQHDRIQWPTAWQPGTKATLVLYHRPHIHCHAHRRQTRRYFTCTCILSTCTCIVFVGGGTSSIASKYRTNCGLLSSASSPLTCS